MPNSSRNSKVHRRLNGREEGEDVKRLQVGIDNRAIHWGFDWINLKHDGEKGPRTERAAEQLLHAMGFFGKGMKKARRGTLSKRAQKLLRGHRRSPAMIALSFKRRRNIRRWRKNYRKKMAAKPPRVIREIIGLVNYLISKNMAYDWGGGHMTPANLGPGDCSWFASLLWQKVEAIATGTTYTLANEGVPGKGKYLTFYIKNIPGQADESHVIVRIWDGKHVRWCETGGRDNTQPGGGPCWFHPTASRISEFNVIRHPKGF